MVRKMVSLASPDLEVEQTGSSFAFKLLSRMAARETHFTIGHEFEEKQPNGVIFIVST
jgi:hypothetical protein